MRFLSRRCLPRADTATETDATATFAAFTRAADATTFPTIKAAIAATAIALRGVVFRRKHTSHALEPLAVSPRRPLMHVHVRVGGHAVGAQGWRAATAVPTHTVLSPAHAKIAPPHTR
jgi:hypothetical protein